MENGLRTVTGGKEAYKVIRGRGLCKKVLTGRRGKLRAVIKVALRTAKHS